MEHPPARSRSTWGHIYRRTTRTRYRKTEKEKIYLLLTQKRTSKHFASYERWEADRCQRSMPMAIASFSRFFLSSTQPCPLRSKSPGICTPRCFGIAHPQSPSCVAIFRCAGSLSRYTVSGLSPLQAACFGCPACCVVSTDARARVPKKRCQP